MTYTKGMILLYSAIAALGVASLLFHAWLSGAI